MEKNYPKADKNVSIIRWIVSQLCDAGYVCTARDIAHWLRVVEQTLQIDMGYELGICGSRSLSVELAGMIRNKQLRVRMARVGSRWGYFFTPGPTDNSDPKVLQEPGLQAVGYVMRRSPYACLAMVDICR